MKKILIIFLILLFSNPAFATVPVKNAYTNVPVNVCTPLDSSANCTVGSGGVSGYWTSNGNNIYNNNTANVGIGTLDAPANKFQVTGTALIGPTNINATGGTITTVGGNTIHTFNTSSTFTPAASGTVNVLAVGAGGGGGNLRGGGGAGGQVVSNTTYAVTAGVPITVTVGTKGLGNTDNLSPGGSGTSTVFGTITALGGPGGGSQAVAAANGVNGYNGSGAGGNGNANTGGTGTSGFNGGNNASSSAFGAGGGAGAGGSGTNGTTTVGGAGGTGVTSSISGTSTCYAGGGGGTVAGTGGTATCGGGAGLSATTGTGNDATANTGAGGGGGGDTRGGNGADGVVIVSYSAGKYLKVDSNGNVGVGQNAPVSLLDINGGITIGSYSGTNTAPSNGLIVSGNVGFGTVTPGVVLDVNGDIRSVGTNKHIFGSDNKAYIQASAATAGDLIINTNSVEAMRVTNLGNIGVGTITPQTKLSIIGNVGIGTVNADGGALIIKGGNVGINSTSPGKLLDLGGGVARVGSAWADTFESINVGTLEFGYTNPSPYQFCRTASCATTSLWIANNANNANVGIGTLTPNARLDIASTDAQNLFMIEDNGSGDPTPFVVDQNGNVGIGTDKVTGAFVVTSGNVGIGTWIPSSPLTIKGTTVMQKLTGANTACATTCGTFACFFGEDTGVLGTLLDCADATADVCLCSK